MPFGGAPCPSLWGYISDTLADVCNPLIHNARWKHDELFYPLSTLLAPPKSLPKSTPFQPALPISVKVPVNDLGKVDIYINDTIGITPDFNNNTSTVSKTIPLTFHSLARPLDPSNKLPRRDIITLKKFTVEGQMEATKVVLGWILNTRLLTQSLPVNKHK
jgi:hypothetical protein